MKCHKFPPSSMVWTCVHDVSYPDICEECSGNILVEQTETEERIELPEVRSWDGE